MITLDDVPEAVACWREGQLSDDMLHGLLLGLLATHEVDAAMRHLPDDVQGHFADHLRSSFDNDSPAECFLSFSSTTGASSLPVVLVRNVRAWLGRRTDEA